MQYRPIVKRPKGRCRCGGSIPTRELWKKPEEPEMVRHLVPRVQGWGAPPARRRRQNTSRGRRKPLQAAASCVQGIPLTKRHDNSVKEELTWVYLLDYSSPGKQHKFSALGGSHFPPFFSSEVSQLCGRETPPSLS